MLPFIRQKKVPKQICLNYFLVGDTAGAFLAVNIFQLIFQYVFCITWYVPNTMVNTEDVKVNEKDGGSAAMVMFCLLLLLI